MLYKRIFIFLFYITITLNALAQDTIYIKSEPITIQKTVFYSKPIDKSFYHNSISAQTLVSPTSSHSFKDSTFNSLTVEKQNLSPQIIVEYAIRSKKFKLGIGLGYQQCKNRITQESPFFSHIDSTAHVEIDSILSDKFLILDTILKWEYQDNGKSYTTTSQTTSRYISIPIRVEYRYAYKKLVLELGAIIQPFFAISTKSTIELIDNQEQKVIQKNVFYKNNFLVLSPDVSISYLINKQVAISFNYRLNLNVSSKYFWQELSKNKYTHATGIGVSYLF